MKELVQVYRQRGFSAFVPDQRKPLSGEAYSRLPHLMFRAYDFGEESQVSIVSDIPVSIEGVVGIQFCPWCGNSLLNDN